MHDEIVQRFEQAGVAGSLCVQDSSGSHEIGVAADELCVAGSVFKVLVAVEVERQIASGLLDPSEPVSLTAESRTPGLVQGLDLGADAAVSGVWIRRAYGRDLAGCAHAS